MHQRLLVEGCEVAPLEMATTARTRSRGLLGRDGLEGALWLSPARQVHTFRMRFAIDVAYVDRDGKVVHVATMPPGRLGRWVARSRGVLEAEAGAFERWGLGPGVRVTLHQP
jgi:uncharacterized membrane protein (UPF0127 family)